MSTVTSITSVRVLMHRKSAYKWCVMTRIMVKNNKRIVNGEKYNKASCYFIWN